MLVQSVFIWLQFVVCVVNRLLVLFNQKKSCVEHMKVVRHRSSVSGFSRCRCCQMECSVAGTCLHMLVVALIL